MTASTFLFPLLDDPLCDQQVARTGPDIVLDHRAVFLIKLLDQTLQLFQIRCDLLDNLVYFLERSTLLTHDSLPFLLLHLGPERLS